MADLITNKAKKEMWDGTIDLLVDTIKLSLHTTGYVQNADDTVMDAGGANDPIDHELSGTGYAAGHGGAGRKTLGSKTIVQDDVNDRAEFDFADQTWASIDAGTAAKAVVHKEGAADDTTAPIVAVIDSGGFPITTNGGDLTYQVNTEGQIHLT